MNHESSLKKKTIRRIQEEMFKEAINHSNASQTILILDNYSAKILSSYFTMSQVLNLGFYSVELLSKERKSYRNYNACYFISPNEESTNLVIKDFENKANPKYRLVHLFFTHSITEDLVDAYTNEYLVKRILTFKEANISFHIKDLNMFYLGNDYSLQLFTIHKNNTHLSIVAQLYTVCTIFEEDFSNIIYQSNSDICMTIAKELHKKLKGKSNSDPKQKKGLMLIIDRLLDPTTPFLHDYSWEALIYDLFPIENNNEIVFDNKRRILNEEDEIWFKYKNYHMAKVFDNLPNDFNDFMNSDLSKQKKENNLETFDQMASAVKNIAEYKMKSDMFSFHLKLAEEVSNVSIYYIMTLAI